METKQVVVLKKFKSLRTGKYCAQAAHASIGAYMSAERITGESLWNIVPINNWLNNSFTKICLQVDTDQELIDLYNKSLEAKIPCSLIKDNGTTEFGGVPTYTAVGIGPWWSEDIDKITKELALF